MPKVYLPPSQLMNWSKKTSYPAWFRSQTADQTVYFAFHSRLSTKYHSTQIFTIWNNILKIWRKKFQGATVGTVARTASTDMVVVQLLGRIESSNQADWRLKRENFDSLIFVPVLVGCALSRPRTKDTFPVTSWEPVSLWHTALPGSCHM